MRDCRPVRDSLEIFPLTLVCLPNYSIHGIPDEVHFIFNIVIPAPFIVIIENCI